MAGEARGTREAVRGGMDVGTKMRMNMEERAEMPMPPEESIKDLKVPRYSSAAAAGEFGYTSAKTF